MAPSVLPLSDEPTTFHVLPCTLDSTRIARGRCLGPDKQEVCPGFVRKKYIPIAKDSRGCLEEVLPGGYKAKEVLELGTRDCLSVEQAIFMCLRCGRRDVEHRSLRSSRKDVSGQPRFKCKECSYCESFCRVDVPGNDICEDCGCEASMHQMSLNEALNTAYRPGDRQIVVGTIMREEEAMESKKITRLAPGTEVEVLARGTGPTGRRIRVRVVEGGQEGWISVVSDAGVSLLKPAGEAGQPVKAPRRSRPSTSQTEADGILSDLTGRKVQGLQSISGLLGSWAGDFAGAEDEAGVSIADLLSGNMGQHFEDLAEEEFSKMPAAPTVAVGEEELPAAEEADTPEPNVPATEDVVSLDDLLRRLSEEEAADDEANADLEAEAKATLEAEANAILEADRRREEAERKAQEEQRLKEEEERREREAAEAAQRLDEEEEEARAQRARDRRKQHMEKMKQRIREDRARKEAQEQEAAGNHDMQRLREEQAERERREQDEVARRQREEEAQKQEEEELARKRQEARRRREEERERRKQQQLEEQKRKEDEEAAQRQEEELRRQEEEQRQEELRQQEESRRQEELRQEELRRLEELRKQEELEELRRQEERQQREEEERRRREEERRIEEERKRFEEEQRRLEEERRRQEAEDAELQRLEEEAAVLRAAEREEEALRQAEEEAEAMRLKEEEEALQWAMEEAERLRLEEEEEQAAQLAAETPDESPLACATRRKDLFRVQALLRDKADPNVVNAVGETPLLEAAASGDINVVALLLGHAADPAKRAPRGALDMDLGLSPEVRLLFKIFQEKKVDSEPKRKLLYSLDPGAHAQVRTMLRLGVRALAHLEGKLSPAAALAGRGAVLEFDATENHSIALHIADPVRPVLVLTPLWQKPTAAVLMLHGLFQSGRMFERLARDLSRNMPHVQFLAPTAPTRGCYFGIGPAWHGTDRVYEDLQDARAEVSALLQGLQHRPPLRRVALLGFSQGGTLATLVALSNPETFAGLLLFGTSGLEGAYYRNSWPGAAGLDVLHCHGGFDRLAPPHEARMNAENMRRAGCRVHFSLYPSVGHTISQEMVTEARDWLSRSLAESPSPAQTHSQAEGLPARSSTQTFDMAADEDTEEELEGGASDLEASFSFEVSPVKIGGDGSDAGDLDAMYDFDAVNSAVLGGRVEGGVGSGIREIPMDRDSPVAKEVFADSKEASEKEDDPGMVTTDAPSNVEDSLEADRRNDSSEEHGEEHSAMERAAEELPREQPQEQAAAGAGAQAEDVAREAREEVDSDEDDDYPTVSVLMEDAITGYKVSLTMPPSTTLETVKHAVAMRHEVETLEGLQLLHQRDPSDSDLEELEDSAQLDGQRHILVLGADLKQPARLQASPLAIAARLGDLGTVKALLQQRADPDQRDAVGETALFSAARGLHADTAGMLLLGKADPSLRSDAGRVAGDCCPASAASVLLRFAAGAVVSAPEQRQAFQALEECARLLLQRLLAKRGVHPVVRDVLCEHQWAAACA